MEIIKTITEMQKKILDIKKSGQTIGYVPTMGYLHEGHLTLAEEARKQSDVVVMSIFVNPLQFGPNEDFDRYPRDIARDENLARNSGVDVLFYPEVTEMYKTEMSFHITVKDKVDVLCGSSRPGHFDGVATVLIKLFNIVQPDYAFFGMKDAQQVAVVTSLVEQFNFPIEIVPVPTVREIDGLAKSSRNVYLLEEEREEATVLYRALQLAKEMIQKGKRDRDAIEKAMKEFIQEHSNASVEYIEIYTFPDLKPIQTLSGLVLIAGAIRFTNVRLIDNMTIDI